METPDAIFRSALQMMPRLEAEESILAVHRGAVASGTLESSARQALIGKWERRAAAPAAAPVAGPRALPDIGLGMRPDGH
jgi:hypothetical protein